MICRNTAGIWDIDEKAVDINREVMKFEAQIGRSLWWVAFNPQINAIATGGADTSVKIWSLNFNEEESKENQSDDVLKYEFDVKTSYSELPFTFTDSDQYFVRSITHWVINNKFYVFASTNIGTIYSWSNEEEKSQSVQLKYIHSDLSSPEELTKEFSIIDVWWTNFEISIEGQEREYILLVAAFEGNTQKQSKSQLLVFDKQQGWGMQIYLILYSLPWPK